MATLLETNFKKRKVKFLVVWYCLKCENEFYNLGTRPVRCPFCSNYLPSMSDTLEIKNLFKNENV